MNKSTINAIYFENGKLKLIDQRILPVEYKIFECENHGEVIFAIKDMVVRGAPAIGAAAAYGVYLAAEEFCGKSDFYNNLKKASNDIRESRPTAVNLMWAVDKMLEILENNKSLDDKNICKVLFSEAEKILSEDIQTNKTMAKIGNEIVPKKATILTHCNTGALATAGYGTALGVVREAFYGGKDIFVFADETRPRLQGARLTAWELVYENIPSKLITDSTAATLIRDGKIDLILVGADRIARNGDTANKIGTFMLSVVAKKYNVPFYIVAPTSTIDKEILNGTEIEIEERDSTEITHVNGSRVAPENIDVFNPAFDVTPNEFITGIITEKGILTAPFEDKILNL